MDEMLLEVVTVAKALAIIIVIGAFCASSQAQSTRPATLPGSAEVEKSDEPRSFASMEEEMRAKNAIKSAEKAHQENLDRARDLSFLSEAVINSYKQKKQLDREDIKKLEKAEKLAKSIREAAGGASDDTKMEKPPQTLASALDLFGELAESLKVKVEKTPKHVISAAVIDEANVLLEVIRIVRSLSPKT